MIKKIFHTADWHLKLNEKNHPIFKQAIENLYLDILSKKEALKLDYFEGLIVIVGDLFDARNKTTNETTYIMGEAIRKLASLFRVYIVAGNHDLDVENISAMDSITPVVELLNMDTVFYLKESKIYEVDNILFANFSIFDNYSRPKINGKDFLEIDPSNLKNKTIVGLYHAPLEGTKADNNQYINYDLSFPPSHFQGCDIVMMGDIHTRQELIDCGATFVYPSSLYQISYGEKVNNQGYALWDIQTYTYEFVTLPSPVKMYKCKFESIDTIRKGKQTFLNCDIQPTKLDETCFIKPIWKDYMHNMSANLKLEIRRLLSKHYNIPLKNIEQVETEYVLFDQGDKTTNKVYNDLKDPAKRGDLYKDFLKNNGYSEKEITDFLALNTKIEEKLPPQITKDTRTFKILNIRGQNFLSFSRFKRTINSGITLIHSNPPNQGGKSNLTRSIMFLLYGKVDYGTTSTNFEDVFNAYLDGKASIVEGEVEINHDVYFLRRKLLKDKDNKITHTFEIYKYDDEGDQIINGKKAFSLKKRTAKETLAFFSNFVGDLDTFTLTSYFTQNTLERILYTKPTERYSQFANYLGLDSFDQKQEIAKQIYKEFLKQSVLSKHEINEVKDSLNTFKQDLDKEISDKKLIELEIEQLQNIIAIQERELLDLSKQLYKVDQDLYINPQKIEEDLLRLNENKTNILKQISDLNEKYGDQFSNVKIGDFLAKRESIIGEINKITVPDNLKNKKSILMSSQGKNKNELQLRDQLQTVDKNLSDIRAKYSSIKNSYDELIEELNGLGEEITCEYCGIKIKDLTDKKAKLQARIDVKSKELQRLLTQGTNIKKDREQLNNLLTETIEENKKNFEKDLQKIEIEIEDYIANERKGFEIQLKEIDNFYQDYLTFSKVEVLLKEQLLCEEQIASKNELLARYRKQENIILTNKNISDKIELLTENKKSSKNNLQTNQNLLSKIEGQIAYLNQKIKDYTKIESSFENELEKDKLYKNYIQLHGKEGIGKYLINAILPTINKYLQDITSTLVDFSILIDFDNTGIQFYLEKNGTRYPLSYGSGYEKTFSCLALHMINMNMSINVPIPNILILDEVFSTVAIENLDNIYNLIKQLLNLYPTVDLVTHIEEVKEWADQDILVEKQDNVSFIN